jgi:hypothetical protein
MEQLRARRWRSIPVRPARPPQRGGLAFVVAVISLSVLGSQAAAAQAGTPATGSDLISPAECTVEPRSEAELRALFREVAATPLPASLDASPAPAVAPAGAPADEQTVAAINATWRQYLACLIAGDQARMFALVSDNLVRRQFVVNIAFGVTEEAWFDHLATPVPLPPDQAVTFVPLEVVRMLSDGRVAAVGPGEGGREEVRIFVQTGDRWLLDEWFELAEQGTPTSGTPRG